MIGNKIVHMFTSQLVSDYSYIIYSQFCCVKRIDTVFNTRFVYLLTI